jgi:hypothetical protein
MLSDQLKNRNMQTQEGKKNCCKQKSTRKTKKKLKDRDSLSGILKKPLSVTATDAFIAWSGH